MTTSILNLSRARGLTRPIVGVGGDAIAEGRLTFKSRDGVVVVLKSWCRAVCRADTRVGEIGVTARVRGGRTGAESVTHGFLRGTPSDFVTGTDVVDVEVVSYADVLGNNTSSHGSEDDKLRQHGG